MQGVIVKVENKPGAPDSLHPRTSSDSNEDAAAAATAGWTRLPLPLGDTLGLLPGIESETFSVQFNVDKVCFSNVLANGIPRPFRPDSAVVMLWFFPLRRWCAKGIITSGLL